MTTRAPRIMPVGRHTRRRTRWSSNAAGRDSDRWIRWFQAAIAFVLMGYVLFDRAFAWVHIPGIPVFAGELVLILAAIVVVRHQRVAADLVRRSNLVKVIGALFLWGLVRLAFDLPAWGLSAMRDAAQTNYILVAIAVAVVVERRPQIVDSLSSLRTWIPALVVAWVPVAIFLNRRFATGAPVVPGSQTSILSFKPGDYAIFAASAVAFVWLNGANYTTKYRNTITFLGIFALLVAGSQNRGGLLGAVVLLGIASLFLARSIRRRFVTGMAVALGGLILVLAVTNIAVPLGNRTFSVGQLAENATSIAGQSDVGGLQGTVNWRLEYWGVVVNDVVGGAEWLTGIGFGPGLADIYGYQTGPNGTEQPLRNAHNSHVTLLARLGLIGLLLWGAFWLRVGIRAYDGSRRGINPVSGLMLAILVGIGVAAIFDPVLEGPQMAIPFWCAVGLVAGTQGMRGSPSAEEQTAIQGRV